MIHNITKEEFSKTVENYVKNKKYTYIDAVIKTLEDFSMDFNLASKHLTKPILEKLEQEGIEINIIRNKKTRLPFA